MAERKTNAEAGDVVELADKEAGFTDPVTGFDISRDQRVKLKDPIGPATNQAIMLGGLLIVSGRSRSSKSDEGGAGGGSDDGSDIPEDLPGRQAFIDAGLNFSQVKALETPDQLMEIKGIGEKTVKDLKAWAKKNPQS